MHQQSVAHLHRGDELNTDPALLSVCVFADSILVPGANNRYGDGNITAHEAPVDKRADRVIGVR